MKKYSSLSRAISLVIMVIFLIGMPLLAVITAYARGYSDDPWWLLGFIPLSMVALGLLSNALYNLRKITITNDYVKVALFGCLFVKRFTIDSIVDIKAIHYQSTRKNPHPLVKVIFSKLIIPDYFPPKTERPNYKETQINFPFSEKDLTILKDLFSVTIKENKSYQISIPNVEVLQEKDFRRKITIIKEKRFWASLVPVYYCIDGKIISKAQNGETVSFLIDQSNHELYMCIYLSQHNLRSNIINIKSGGDDMIFKLKSKADWWHGEAEFTLIQQSNELEK